MAAAAGHTWPRQQAPPPPPPPTADVSSPNYPDRPIRPLPRRSLRARLSDDQARLIVYPPVPPSSSPIFGSSPQSQQDRIYPASGPLAYNEDHQYVAEQESQPVRQEPDHSEVCHCGEHSHSDLDSEDDDAHYSQRYGWHDQDGRATSRAVRAKTAPASSGSSADGYESFENTNNKKKRKIPISDDRGGKYYPGQASTGVGMSAPGRGRVARTRQISDHRKPLVGALNSVNINPASSYPMQPSHGGTIPAPVAGMSEKVPNSGPRGQENMGQPGQHPPASSAVGHGNQNKEFSFNWPSETAAKMGQNLGIPPQQSNPAGRGSMPATYPSSSHYPSGMPDANLPPPPPPSQQPAAGQQPGAVPKKKPRRPGRVLERQARRRKREQAAANYYNPPKPEDEWICEFCEYELIFGAPPTALVRQYEMKDRRERKRQAEQRRLLDKAKAKGRKNRKNKNAAKNAASAGGNKAGNQNYDPHYDNASPQDYDESQGEEFYDDTYDDHAPVSSPHPDDYPPDDYMAGQAGGGGGGTAHYGPPLPPNTPVAHGVGR